MVTGAVYASTMAGSGVTNHGGTFQPGATVEVIDRCLRALGERLPNPQWAAHEAVIRWDITQGIVSRTYQMLLTDASCSVSEEAPVHPRVMVGISLTDLVPLSVGQLDLMEAFMSGRVRLSGDLGLARQLQTCLEQAPPA
jgi:hypothetical protein